MVSRTWMQFAYGLGYMQTGDSTLARHFIQPRDAPIPMKTKSRPSTRQTPKIFFLFCIYALLLSPASTFPLSETQGITQRQARECYAAAKAAVFQSTLLPVVMTDQEPASEPAQTDHLFVPIIKPAAMMNIPEPSPDRVRHKKKIV